MNQHRELLLKLIFILINQSYLDNDENKVILNLVERSLNVIKLPEVTVSSNDMASLILSLYGVIVKITEVGIEEPLPMTAIKMELKAVSLEFPDVMELIDSTMKDVKEADRNELMITVRYLKKDITNVVSNVSFHRVIQQSYFDLTNELNSGEKFKMNKEKFLQTMLDKLLPTVNTEEKSDAVSSLPCVDDFLSLSDRDRFNSYFKQALDMNTLGGILTFDLQGWNEALGGGLRRGEGMNTTAKSHGGKTAKLLKELIGIAKTTTPLNINKDKKPTLVFYTLENTVEQMILIIYKTLMEEEFDAKVDLASLKDKEDECYDFVFKFFSNLGWELLIVYRGKNKLSDEDFNITLERMEINHEVHYIAFDYLQLAVPSSDGNAAVAIQKLAGSLMSTCKAKLIAFSTANQMNDDGAERINAESDAIKKMAVSGRFEKNCRSIYDECDIHCLVNIEEAEDGYYYHQLSVGKHRLLGLSSIKNRYAVYKMHCDAFGNTIGFIKSDTNIASQVRNSTGGSLRSEEEAMGGASNDMF